MARTVEEIKAQIEGLEEELAQAKGESKSDSEKRYAAAAKVASLCEEAKAKLNEARELAGSAELYFRFSASSYPGDDYDLDFSSIIDPSEEAGKRAVANGSFY